MCGRFTLYAQQSDLVERFSVDEVAEAVSSGLRLSPRWNVAPSQDVAVVTVSADGARRRLETMRWGLVPSWADDPSIGNRLINARAETVASKPAFRRAFAGRRCLIPADGFYEWRRDGAPTAGGRGRSSHRTPFYAQGADGRTLALAGLWEIWHDDEGPVLRTCTIVTTTANGVLAPVHDRMPVLVTPEDWGTWLAPEPLADEEVARLLAPAPVAALVVHPVSDRVNRPVAEGPDLIERRAEAVQEPLTGSPGSG